MGGHLSANPARRVKKARSPRREEVQPLAPGTIEAMRVALDARDATLISMLAYAGLRPGEALGLRWGDVRDQTLLVQRAISLGEEADTKTRQHRTVRLLAPLAADLRTWRMPPGAPMIASSCSLARKANPGPNSLTSPGADGRSVGRRRRPASHMLGRRTYATVSRRCCSTRDGASSTGRASSVTTQA